MSPTTPAATLGEISVVGIFISPVCVCVCVCVCVEGRGGEGIP